MPEAHIGLFDLKAGNPKFKGVEPSQEKIDAIREVHDKCDFPWQRMIPRISARREGRIPVVFESRGGAGSWWPNGVIVLEPRLSVSRTAEVFIYEAAHAVDVLTFDDAERMALHTLFHGGGEVHDAWGEGHHHEQAKEAFMYAFYNAFVERGVKVPNYGPHHDVTDWQTIRSIVLRRKIVTFKDVEGNAHQKNIEDLAGVGIIKGTGDGEFSPNDNVTRAQNATMLANLLDEVKPGWRPREA